MDRRRKWQRSTAVPCRLHTRKNTQKPGRIPRTTEKQPLRVSPCVCVGFQRCSFRQRLQMLWASRRTARKRKRKRDTADWLTLDCLQALRQRLTTDEESSTRCRRNKTGFKYPTPATHCFDTQTPLHVICVQDGVWHHKVLRRRPEESTQVS